MRGIANNGSNVLGALFSRSPSPLMCKYYRLIWMAVYILMFAFKESLPEKFGRDASTLARMVESGTGDDGAYGAMATIYSYVPGFFLPFLPLLLCLPSLWIILGYVRSYAVMLILPIILMPYLMMNFLFPSKETLVALMAIMIYRLSQSKIPVIRAFLLILLLYGVYAAFVRSYYFLILAFFSAVVIGRKVPLPLTLCATFIGIAVLGVLLPAQVFQEIQGARDTSSWAMMRMTNEVRTLFFNPFPPDNMLNFLGNMGFGLLVMFVPFVIAQTFNEVLMLVNVLFYTGLVLGIMRHKHGTAALPAMLFIGHILTQAQFEPDLGSYVRHFSSVLVILAPGIQYLLLAKPNAPAVEPHALPDAAMPGKAAATPPTATA
jgi:hypothetical protein